MENDIVREHRKKNTFLAYLTILFVVAFLLVLLSYLMQLRDSRATISELNESNISVLANAQRLQQANEALSGENADLREQLRNARDAQAELQTQLEAAETAQQTAADDVAAAYEALLLARGARDSGDHAVFLGAMQTLEPLAGYLSAEGTVLYQQLKLDLTAETVE